MGIVVIEDKEAFDRVLQEAGDKLVVVDFTASWCGPCRNIAPFYKELSEKEENKNVVFLKVDVDEAQDVASFCEIKCMPTFHFYKNGKKVDDFSGSNPSKLADLVQMHNCWFSTAVFPAVALVHVSSRRCPAAQGFHSSPAPWVAPAKDHGKHQARDQSCSALLLMEQDQVLPEDADMLTVGGVFGLPPVLDPLLLLLQLTLFTAVLNDPLVKLCVSDSAAGGQWSWYRFCARYSAPVGNSEMSC
ncbi:thioredoxin-like [Arapaima gigas]